MKTLGKIITFLLVFTAIFLWIFYPQRDKWVQDLEELLLKGKKNHYIAEEFYKDGEFLRYGASEHMVGVDVSTHQGEIDWEQVADAGVEFAILRAGYRGYSKGEMYEDDCFDYNYRKARKAGLKVGVYFFSQASTEEEALEEARYVCSLLEGKDLDLPVFYDWEYLEGRVPQVWELSVADLAVKFCEEVSRKGYEPGVYFNRDYGDNYLELEKLQDYVIWLAEYSDTPKASYHFHCLQYTDQGSVPGIRGDVDLDLLILEGAGSPSEKSS